MFIFFYIQRRQCETKKMCMLHPYKCNHVCSEMAKIIKGTHRKIPICTYQNELLRKKCIQKRAVLVYHKDDLMNWGPSDLSKFCQLKLSLNKKLEVLKKLNNGILCTIEGEQNGWRDWTVWQVQRKTLHSQGQINTCVGIPHPYSSKKLSSCNWTFFSQKQCEIHTLQPFEDKLMT